MSDDNNKQSMDPEAVVQDVGGTRHTTAGSSIILLKKERITADVDDVVMRSGNANGSSQNELLEATLNTLLDITKRDEQKLYPASNNDNSDDHEDPDEVLTTAKKKETLVIHEEKNNVVDTVVRRRPVPANDDPGDSTSDLATTRKGLALASAPPPTTTTATTRKTVDTANDDNAAKSLAAVPNLPQQQQQPGSSSSEPGAYARAGPGAEAAAALNRNGSIIWSIGGSSGGSSISIDFASSGAVDYNVVEPPSISAGAASFDPSSSEGQLAEARPVLEDEQQADNTTQIARAVDSVQLLKNKKRVTQQRQQTQQEKDQQCQLFFGLAAILCSIAIILAVLFGVVGIGDSTEEEKENHGASSSFDATIVTTPPPSAAPTVGVLDDLLMDLPDDTIARMNGGSDMPQWKAWNWLSNHPNLVANVAEQPAEELLLWKKKQLFALATFYYSFGGENWPWYIQDRWLDYTKDECLWFSSGHGYFREGEFLLWDDCTGTYCKGTQQPCNERGEFTKLILWNMELEGLAPSLPPEIALLTSLSVVSLSSNDVDAPLSALLPQELHQLTNLTDLVLIRNNLRGTIPSEIASLASLTRLDIFKNDLTGQLPSEVGLMTHLEYCSLGRNELTGQVPSELGLLTRLTHLHLHRNQMSGLLPSALGFLTAMKDLYLYSNNFSGSLPTELGSWVRATTLRLQGNSFTGAIPKEFGTLTSLARLEISNNLLSGAIPNEVGLISSLAVLQLHNNRLTGVVPSELNETLSMSLDGNQFTGAVPPQLCSVLWCDCSSSVSLSSTCEMLGDPPEWPGRYPQGSENKEELLFALNIHTDKDPSETEWFWEEKTNVTGVFQSVVDSGGALELGDYLNSFILAGTPNTIYRLSITDRWSDGLWAGGWITLTTANQTVVCASEMNPRFSEISFVVEVALDGSVDLVETHLA